jgi:enoyl-CoA hydratase/carnithine racemase
MQAPVYYRFDNGVAVITMDSPPANAFSDALHDAFLAVLAELQNLEVRAAIITGSGRFFQAGGDMQRFLTLQTLDEARAFVKLAQDFMNAIAATPYPTIAAINGYALGGGLEIALACDIRLAATSALLGLPEARYGILAGAGGTQRLARLIGPGRAKLMMYSGRQLDARQAFEIGLVDAVVEDAGLLAQARSLAAEIASNSPLAVRQIKRCVDQGLDLPLTEALELEREYWAQLIPPGDYREGVRAWFEKRAPIYPYDPLPDVD